MLLALDTVGVFRVAPVPTRDPRSHGWAPFPIVAVYSSFDIRAVAASSAKRETAKPTVSDALVETGDLSITVDVTRGGALRAGNALDVVPLVVGHMSWTLPLLNAGERRKSSGKGEEPVVPVTIVDVEALAISIADLALLYKRRLEAHLLHIVCRPVLSLYRCVAKLRIDWLLCGR